MERVYKTKETGKLIIFSILIFGILEIGFIRFVYPSYYTDYLLLIPVYFLLLGISVMFMLSRMKRNKSHPGRAIVRLMSFNVAQMLLSFFLMFCYYFFADVQEHTILIAFSIFYIFFMGLKLFILIRLTQRLKNANKNT